MMRVSGRLFFHVSGAREKQRLGTARKAGKAKKPSRTDAPSEEQSSDAGKPKKTPAKGKSDKQGSLF